MKLTTEKAMFTVLFLAIILVTGHQAQVIKSRDTRISPSRTEDTNHRKNDGDSNSPHIVRDPREKDNNDLVEALTKMADGPKRGIKKTGQDEIQCPTCLNGSGRCMFKGICCTKYVCSIGQTGCDVIPDRCRKQHNEHACSETGVCAADGICCEKDGCFRDKTCSSLRNLLQAIMKLCANGNC